jgi:hypothetical protein
MFRMVSTFVTSRPGVPPCDWTGIHDVRRRPSAEGSLIPSVYREKTEPYEFQLPDTYVDQIGPAASAP